MKKKEIKITQEAFDAFELEAKVGYIDYVREILGDPGSQIQIGSKIFKDREELQSWKIGKGYISHTKNN